MRLLIKLLFLSLCTISVLSDSEYVVVDVNEDGIVEDKVVNTHEPNHETQEKPSPPPTEIITETNTQEDSNNEDILELIDLELKELDSLIALGRRKIDLLGNMRKHVVSGKRLPKSVNLSDLEKTLSRVERPPQPQSYNVPQTGFGTPLSGGSGSDLLMLHTELKYNSTIVATVVMPFKSRAASRKAGSVAGGYVSVLALCDAEGTLMFVDPDTGSLLHSQFVGVEGEYATKLSFEGGSGSEVPVIAVGTNNGAVTMLSLTLWQNDVIIAGKKPRIKKDDNGEPLPGQNIPTPPAITSDSGLGIEVKHLSTFHVKDLERTASIAVMRQIRKKKGEEDMGDADLEIMLPPPVPSKGPSGITALLVYSVRGGDTGSRRMVAVGDGTGSVFAVTSNGTLMRNATVRGGYARDIKKQGNTLAVCEDLGVSFMSLTRFSFTSSYCKGGAHPAESLAVDVLSPGMIYVAFAGGEVILYNSKAKSTSAKGAMTCTKVQKLNTGAMTPTASSVHTVRGYVIVGALNTHGVRDDGVLIFNSSNIREMGVRYISRVSPPPPTSTCSNLSWYPSAPLSVSFIGSSLKLPELLVAVTSSSACGEVVTLYEALLSYEPPVNDMSWVRMPMLAGGLIMVFGWQFFKGKGSGGGGMFGGGGRRGRGGRGGGGDDDIAQMMASMGGGGGGGLGRGFDTGGGRGY